MVGKIIDDTAYVVFWFLIELQTAWRGLTRKDEDGYIYVSAYSLGGALIGLVLLILGQAPFELFLVTYFAGLVFALLYVVWSPRNDLQDLLEMTLGGFLTSIGGLLWQLAKFIMEGGLA